MSIFSTYIKVMLVTNWQLANYQAALRQIGSLGLFSLVSSSVIPGVFVLFVILDGHLTD